MNIRLPGPHSIHWKVFAFHLAVLIMPVGYLAWQLRHSLESTELHATEEGMIDTASMAGGIYSQLYKEAGGNGDEVAGKLARYLADMETVRSAKSRLFGFTPDEEDTRLIFYDATGRVRYDTVNSKDVGADQSAKPEVRRALSGHYGSRWQLDRGPHRVLIFAAVPVWEGGHIIGAVSVVKPTNRLVHFIVRTLQELAWPAVGAVLLAAVLAYALSAYLTSIVRSLAAKAERIAAGETGIRLQTWTRSELGTLARAVERMRGRLEGKAYVEETVANLSHELKTPLAAIRGAAELLEDGAVNDPVACPRFLRNIQQETARLDDIVNGLLELARVETAMAPEPAVCVDLTAVARDLAAPVYEERAARLGVRFSWAVPDSPTPCLISEIRIRQLLGNLLDNALHFTPEGHAVRMELAREEGWARLTVRDEGRGIEPEILPRLFERFFTTGNPRTGVRGTGLGLALVKSIVQAAGGSVEVRSQLGVGSEFVARLPISPSS